jgi:hypothetical protein
VSFTRQLSIGLLGLTGLLTLMACENIEASKSLQEARAAPIAAVFHSERWSGNLS